MRRIAARIPYESTQWYCIRGEPDMPELSGILCFVSRDPGLRSAADSTEGPLALHPACRAERDSEIVQVLRSRVDIMNGRPWTPRRCMYHAGKRSAIA